MPDQTPSTPPPAEQKESIGAVLKRLGPAAWLGIAWATMPAIAGITLLANMDLAQRLLIGTEEEPGLPFATGIMIYIAIFIITAGLGLLPTVSQAILAGYAFGVTWGFPAALIGFAGASIVGYFIANTIARKRVEDEIQKHAKVEIIRDAFIRHGYARALLILTLIRVPPNSPFALTNYAMSVSGVKLVPYLIATLVGMAPRTFAAVWIGSTIDNWGDAKTPRWMVIGGILLTIVILIGLGKLANKALEQAMKASPGGEPDPDVLPRDDAAFDPDTDNESELDGHDRA